jgi:FkbM family methyltransferase
MKPIVISIGSFSAQQVIDTLANNLIVVAYDPRLAMCEAYSKINNINFRWFPQAVSGKAGKLTLYEHGGSSTVLPMTNCPFQIDDVYDVDVVAMTDVLLPYESVEHLSLNCEGSEISIIMDTPIELLARCKNIGVEFHHFCDYLDISDVDVQQCVTKLEERFTSKIVNVTQPYISFKLK